MDKIAVAFCAQSFTIVGANTCGRSNYLSGDYEFPHYFKCPAELDYFDGELFTYLVYDTFVPRGTP